MLRIVAILLVVLMTFQIAPVKASEGEFFQGGVWVSDEFTSRYWTVNFYAWEEEVLALYVRDGAAIGELPEAPLQKNMIFTGWFADGEEITEHTKILSDMEITALYLSVEEVTMLDSDDLTNESLYLDPVTDSDFAEDHAEYLDPVTHEIGEPLALFQAEKVQVSVLYGSIPDEVNFRQYTQEETDDLVSRYGLSGSRAGSSSTASGYTAFDVSMLQAEGGTYVEDGLYSVSVELDFNVMDLVPAGAQIDHVNYTLHHIHEDSVEELEVTVEDRIVTFTTERFSPFVLQYTVDFHFEIDGKVYQFSLPGGGFISLRHLIEVLGISNPMDPAEDSGDARDENEDNKDHEDHAEVAQDSSAAYDAAISLNRIAVSESTKQFVANVADLTFSSPELVWTGKVDTDSTVGSLKETNGLECRYSAELTEEQIAEINAQTVEAGDWILISLVPFKTEETLTVNMLNGDSFVIQVTDAQIVRDYISASGEKYRITVEYDDDVGIPEGADLIVEEILQREESDGGAAEYDIYLEKTREALGLTSGTFAYARFFDITIVDETGGKVEINAPVNVRVELADKEEAEDSTRVVHFADGSENGDVLSFTAETSEYGQVVTFEADGFSVYAIVEAPEPVNFDPYDLNSVDEITEGKAYLLSYGSPKKYFTSAINNNSCLIENTDSYSAAEWYFEIISGTENTYYIYTMVDGVKKYIHQKSDNNNIELADAGTPITLSEAGSDTPYRFLLKHSSQNRWLQHSNGGGGIRFYTEKSDKTNSRIYITDAASMTPADDPYGLDGKSFGIAYHDESVTAAALTAEARSNQQRLVGTDLLIRPDVLENEGYLLVSEGSDITEWTFECVQQDQYYLTATVDGTKKYLTFNGSNIYLSDTPDLQKSVITARPGTGENAGKWHFVVGNYALNLPGKSSDGFNAVTGNGATTWLNLVEKSFLNEEDFTLYSAQKVSVSDTVNVYNGQQVVIYTRIWNETAKKYEFYAVDHDGSLIRVYESGDQISWVGSQVNSALWEFTEYYNADGTPNYYYELQNMAYPNTYLVPQSSGIVSGTPIGINLEGRRNGENYTTILSWDDAAYGYSGLRVETTENGRKRIMTCPKDEADDFYFAVITPQVQEADPLTTVETVDNSKYGISIKMVDFNNRIVNKRDSVQNSFFGGHEYNPSTQDSGLLSSNLVNGYPTTTASTGNEGHSLSELFTGMTAANHLFIQSVYNESGYSNMTVHRTLRI